jgi:protein SCO1/2
MKGRAGLCALTIIILSALVADGNAGLSQNELKRVGYDQHLGQQISRGLIFQESDKQSVALGELFNSKPTLLVLGYYHCPMLCTVINDGLIGSLQELRLNVGRDFNIISASIDPNETPAMAAAKKREYLQRYGRPNAAAGWHFLTGNKETIAQLANEAGFRFRYDSATHEYAHPSGFIVLTPTGRVSRYFFGVNFDPKELRASLVAASRGEQGSVIKQLILLCFHYNPLTGKYGALILNGLRVASVVTVLILAAWIIGMFRRDRRLTPGTEAG